jgi:hypothetical protein
LLTLGEKRRLRVFEYRSLRRIFASKKDQVRRQQRKLHSEELSDLYIKKYFSGDQTKKNEEEESHYWGEERCKQVFGGEL